MMTPQEKIELMQEQIAGLEERLIAKTLLLREARAKMAQLREAYDQASMEAATHRLTIRELQE